MKTKATVASFGVVLALAGWGAPDVADARGTVRVGDTTYVCQNMCEVYRDFNGRLSVRDVANGWVLRFSERGPVTVPQQSSPDAKVE